MCCMYRAEHSMGVAPPSERRNHLLNRVSTTLSHCMKNVFRSNVNQFCAVAGKSPLATPIRLCETAQRDDKKAGQGRRADRPHGAQTGETQRIGLAAQFVPGYRLARP